MNLTQKIFYPLKPFLPRPLQIALRRLRVSLIKKKYEDVWPIYEKAGSPPEGWSGWPDNKKFALVLTHDVETESGQKKCIDLMNLEKELGFKSSFYFVPEGYDNFFQVHRELRNNGFEVGVHGLNHDGRLFQSKNIFLERCLRINDYLSKWHAVGFRSPGMYHNLEWTHTLNIEYDASTYDIDPFEPQGGGTGTIFPFIVKDSFSEKSYVELPYTLPQDFLMFVLMKEKSIDIWKRKLDWIVQRGGMALLITHPDYMNFTRAKSRKGQYPAEYYSEFLNYIKSKYAGQYWMGSAKDVATFYNEKINNSIHGISESCISNRDVSACSIAYTFYGYDYRVRRYAELLSGPRNTVNMIALRAKGGKKRDRLNKVDVLNIREREYNETGPLNFLYKFLMFFLKGSLVLTLRHLKFRYRIIHIHNVPDFLIFMGFIPKLLGAKLILDIHDALPEFYCEKFNKRLDSWEIKMLLFLENISVRFADHVIVANDIWREKITDRTGIPSSKCTTILNYPQLSFFNHTKAQPENGELIIIYPGTMSKHHGIDIAIKAMAIVKKELPSARLHFYSSPQNLEYSSFINNLIEDLDLKENIKFFEPVPVEEIGKKLSTATMGIVPKRGGIFAGEAFSTKILEFMAAGLPVIASKTPIDEYYFNDSMIMFFEMENHKDLARCIVNLYKDVEKQKSLIKNGKQFIATNNWDSKQAIYLNIVAQLTK